MSNESPMLVMHVGRSWTGTELEDACPCPKQPCGLVVPAEAAEECTQHPPKRVKTIRQAHPADRCPGRR